MNMLSSRGYSFLLMYMRAQAVLPHEEWLKGGCMYGVVTDDLVVSYLEDMGGMDIPIPLIDKLITCDALCLNCKAVLTVQSDCVQILDTCPHCTGSYNTNEILTDLSRYTEYLEGGYG